MAAVKKTETPKITNTTITTSKPVYMMTAIEGDKSVDKKKLAIVGIAAVILVALILWKRK
ncbi:MAG: hypothetical protein J6R17_01370 [Bacteroidales bacterium]|nr:hypothetical protein [Bacteroidales bacterium]